MALLLFGVAAGTAFGASVGGGAPSYVVQQTFIDAFNRGQFAQRVVSPPAKDVRALGSPGLVQEFVSKTDSSIYALINPDPASTDNLITYQVFGDIYNFFNSLGVGVVGYPMGDTAACPANGLGACDFQIFSKNYALFVYPGQIPISVHDPIFTEWNNGGAIQVYGAALSATAVVTSPSTVVGTQQVFANGTIFSYPNSSTTPVVFGVSQAFNTAFNNQGGYAHLGFPTSDAFTTGTAGLIRQTFEEARIEMMPGSDPNVLYSIALLGIPGQAQGLSLAVGASAILNASTIDTRSQVVTGRALSWSTSNGSAVRVVGNGDTATIQAVGPGSANIYVSGEGVTSAPLTVRVTRTCCVIGEGSPSLTISQAFQASVDRNHLAVSAPTAPVARVGGGYIQTLTASDGSGARYILSQADNAGIAYLLTATLNSGYLSAGGFAGPLGYPASDPLPGGWQKFTSGAALGGSPARVVPAPVAAKWIRLGAAQGSLGSPVADSSSFLSTGGSSGLAQMFAGGEIFAVTGGSKSGQAFFSSGPILARYLALGGPGGALGSPLADVSTGSVQIEFFENGTIDLQQGAAAAVEYLNRRRPAVTVSSANVVPGGREHISATGFAPGATLAFAVTDQPGFSIQSASGTFSWDEVVPVGAKAGSVSIRVTAQGSSDSATATYSVTPLAAALPKFSVVSGDQQTGFPGSVLANPVILRLQDAAGSPLSGVPVSFSGSGGAKVLSPLVTDQNGQVALRFRLPPQSGVAVGSLTAGSQVVNFSALAASGVIQNFPVFAQTDPAGSFAASLAALLRYYQNLGYLAIPNGNASPSALGPFLAAKGGFVQVAAAEQVINPWVAAQFANAGLWIEDPGLDRIRDLLNAGTPLVLILNLNIDGGLLGSTAVDAVGVGPDGSILIDDPNPGFGRTSLADYLNGFSAQGHQVQAAVASVLRIGIPSASVSSAAFTVASAVGTGGVTSSPAGACPSVEILSSVSSAGERFQYCDGSQPTYEFDSQAPAGAIVSDLGGGPVQQIPANAGNSWSVGRAGGGLTVGPQTLAITAVTDSAAFGSRVAPGELITLFGTGLASGQNPVVSLNGSAVSVSAALPFQINALIPAGAPIGKATLQVQDALGTAMTNIVLSAVAPAIFAIGSQGTIVNADGTLNGVQSPAQRGQYVSIYCTGLGAITERGGLQVVTESVSVKVNGTSLTPSYAGLAPGFAGLYQINVVLPGSLVPITNGTLAVQQGGIDSNAVGFALQ